jgi:hypothetical protein
MTGSNYCHPKERCSMPDDADRPGRALLNASARSGKLVSQPRALPGWSEPEWLGEWIRNTLEPPPAPLDDIDRAISEITQWLWPVADPAACLGPLGEMFGLPDNWQWQAPLYDEALGDLPEWALQEAVRACLRHCKFFPKPAEIRERLPDQLMQMRIAKLRLETAVSRWRLAGNRRIALRRR